MIVQALKDNLVAVALNIITLRIMSNHVVYNKYSETFVGRRSGIVAKIFCYFLIIWIRPLTWEYQCAQ